MTLKLVKDSPDIGIVTLNAEESLKFYRDTLGLPYQRKMESPDGSVVHFLAIGTSSLKIWQVNPEPTARAPSGDYKDATGYRYITVFPEDIADVVNRCAAAGYEVATPLSEPRPGLMLAFVRDPDGNNIELLQMARQ